jgi:hypothetical protein
MNTQNTQDNLEEIVDALGVKGTLEALAQVCFDKSEHLASNWQDEASAKVYSNVGSAINKFAYKTIEQRFGFTG